LPLNFVALEYLFLEFPDAVEGASDSQYRVEPVHHLGVGVLPAGQRNPHLGPCLLRSDITPLGHAFVKVLEHRYVTMQNVKRNTVLVLVAYLPIFYYVLNRFNTTDLNRH
jgi:hypothetical protein